MLKESQISTHVEHEMSAKDLFIRRKVHESLESLYKEFQPLRNYTDYESNENEKVHKCSRDPICKCAVYAELLIHIAHELKTDNVQEFLRGFFYSPNSYLPFKTFTMWVQLEIYRGNNEFAEKMIKNYMRSSTKLLDIFEKNDKNISGFLKKFNLKPSVMLNDDDLVIYENEVYELLEILLFHVTLCSKGFEQTKEGIMSTPLPRAIKLDFIRRLRELYLKSKEEHNEPATSVFGDEEEKALLDNKSRRSTSENGEISPAEQEPYRIEGRLQRPGNKKSTMSSLVSFTKMYKYNLGAAALLVAILILTKKSKRFVDLIRYLYNMRLVSFLAYYLFGVNVQQKQADLASV